MEIVWLLVVVLVLVYLRDRLFWPWPLSLDGKYIKLVKAFTKEAKLNRPAKKDFWKWNLQLKKLILTHNLYLHLNEKCKNKFLLKDIKYYWVIYIKKADNILHIHHQPWDILEGKPAEELMTSWQSDAITLEEIEKRFNKLNK